MYYRILGGTGLQCSVLSYGFWATFGVKPGLKDQDGLKAAKACLTVAREGGVNLFDNAEAYGVPNGEAERLMGQALYELNEENPELWRRSDLLITTKVFWGGSGVNEVGLSRKHITEAVEASLARLQLSYVDLLFCHRPDPFTPTETVVRAMSDMVRQGFAMSWGTSEWSAQQITEAYWIARSLGLEPPQIEQPQYHMFHRDRFEVEYAPLYQAPYRMGTTTWSPLASGILTGKYNQGVPEGSRVAQPGYEWLEGVLAQHKAKGNLDRIEQLMAYAEERFECSVAQLALAWCVKNPNVSTVLLGATRPEQLEENLGALKIAEQLRPEHMQEIDQLLENRPQAYQGWGGAGMRSLNTI